MPLLVMYSLRFTCPSCYWLWLLCEHKLYFALTLCPLHSEFSKRGDLAPNTIRQRDRLEVDVAPTTVSEDEGLEVDVAPTTVSEDEGLEVDVAPTTVSEDEGCEEVIW